MGSLCKQGQIYTAQFYHNGIKYRRTTGTGDKRLALQKAKEIEKEIKRAQNIVDIEMTKKKRSFASLKDISVAYIAGCERRALLGQKMNMKTANRNLQDLSKLCSGLEHSSTILTPAQVDNYATAVLNGKTGQDLIRGRNSVEALHRRARSVFSDWALKYYKENGLLLPDVLPWRKHRAVKEDHGTYRVPIEQPELCERTLKAGRQLIRNNDILGIAWILQYEFAMRANEICHIQWNWFVKRGEHYALLIVDRPDLNFSVKGTNREIQVHRDVFLKLKELAELYQTGEFICPGNTYNSRNNFICRDLAQWMRFLGWDKKTFQKAGYELRKLKGSAWFSDPKLGPAVAQEWLGHKDISTTVKYYSALIIKSEPQLPSWL